MPLCSRPPTVSAALFPGGLRFVPVPLSRFPFCLIPVMPMLRQLLIRLLVAPIRFYRRYVSPLTPPSCRFTPTCSQYAIEAIQKHGPFKGLYLAVRRLLRCHPFGGSGYDPVP